ncbi:MAG TPA: branched-chain amino acid ABC transporter permease [Spirochaetales bacterium]|nr:branched-chain amino acid ABC transporter permease [Spirochaetales bacterium]HOV37450.1 branched-chain amino acid ABC transporter permease [Spirochaetales bacterium]
METFLSQLIFGIQRGTIYALIALGYTMVYGVVRLINFAYGEVFMIGAFASFFLVNALDLPQPILIILAFLIPMAVCSLLGLAMDALAYRPLRQKPRLAALITAIGVSFFLGNFVSYSSGTTIRNSAGFAFILAFFLLLYVLGVKYLNFPVKATPAFRPRKFIIPIVSLLLMGIIFWISKDFLLDLRWKGSSFASYPVDRLLQVKKIHLYKAVYITNIQIMNILISIALMVLLSYLVNRTLLGMAMRASKNNKDAVSLMGINVDRIISITFIIGTALAGAAGVLSGITYPRLTAFMGVQPGLKAFIAAVLGGIGSIEGAMLGGILMGVAEQFAIGLLPSNYGPNHMDFTPLADGVAFAILIGVLLLRPQGIFGEPPREKL